MNILFIINGHGLGNSTRCHALIEEFEKTKCKITIATSGNGLIYFNKEKAKYNLREMQTLVYEKNKKNELSIFKTLCSLPKLVSNYFKNIFLIRQLIKEQHFDLIFIDSDYSLLFLKPLIKCKIISINNSLTSIKYSFKLFEFGLNYLPQYLIEFLDFIFQLLIPDLVICPTLSNSFEIRSKFIQTPPITRKFNDDCPKKFTTLMFSTSGLYKPEKLLTNIGDLTNFIYIGPKPESKFDLKMENNVIDSRSILEETKILISNGGLSSLSEAYILGIPTLIIPIENHFEQRLNAEMLAYQNLGVVSKHDQIDFNYQFLMAHCFSNDFSYKTNGKRSQILDKIIQYISAECPVTDNTLATSIP